MPLFHLVLVALVQGITEFLPISSSAHLILLPALTGMADQGLVIDVAAHIGTLAAVILYFRRDVAAATVGLGRLLMGRADTPGARLALHLAIATLPVMAAGLALRLLGLTEALRSVTLIGWTTLVFGLLLYRADQTGAERLQAAGWRLPQAVLLGLWQAVALVPGVSRSGIVITGARFLGFARADAARLSMLMSIPTTLVSALLLGAEVAVAGDGALARDGAIVAALTLVSTLAALAIMMRLLRTVSFTPYVVYRVLLGAALLIYSYA